MTHRVNSPENQLPKLRVTQFVNANGQPLTKSIRYCPLMCELETTTAAQMTSGIAVNRTVNGFDDFANHLEHIRNRTSTAIAYGLMPREGEIPIAAKDLIAAGYAAEGATTRTNDVMMYADSVPGILPIDFDVKGEGPDWSEHDNIICSVMFEIAPVKRLYQSSASSALYYGDKPVSEKSGWRAFIPVDNAARIPAIGRELFARLVDAEYGWIEISKSGQRLLRSPIDAAMYQPSRLDFVSGAGLGEGLEWHPQTHKRGELELLRTADIEWRDFDAWRASSPIVAKLLADALPEARRVNAIWRAERVKEAVVRGVPREKAERIYQKAAPEPSEHNGQCIVGELEGGFRLYKKDGTSISIDEAVSDPSKYHRSIWLDPMEPDYPSGECAMLFLKGQRSFPVMYSQAHGGMSYRLVQSPERQTSALVMQTMNRAQSSGPVQCFLPAKVTDISPLLDRMGSGAIGIVWGMK